MTRKPDARKTVFFHVLKTGGTTFSQVLRDLYPGSFEMIRDPRVEVVEATLERNACIEFHTFARGSQLVNMHSGLAEGDRFDLLRGQQVFTMLRDPVEQALSLYRHILRHRSLAEPLLEVAEQRVAHSLEEFLDEPRHFNSQTAFLADRNQILQLADEDDLARAKRLLVELNVHVGLTERFNDAVHILEQVTGRRIPGGRIVNRNRNPAAAGSAPVSEAVRQRIRASSALDVELYRFGRELFLADLARYGSAPAYEYVEEDAAEAGEQSHAPRAAAAAARSPWTRLKAKLTRRGQDATAGESTEPSGRSRV